MAKVKIIFWEYRANADGTFPVRIRTSKGNTRFYTDTGVSVIKEQWDYEKLEVKRNNPNYKRANNLIQSLKIKITNECMRLEEMDRSVSTRKIKKEIKYKNTSFFEFAEDFYKRYNTEAQNCTYTNYTASFKKFETYMGSRNLSIQDLDYETLFGFQQYLKKLGNYHTTIEANLAKLKAVYTQAIRIGVVDRNNSPFYELNIERGPGKSEKHKLTEEEIDTIRALELKPDSLLFNVRSAFLFAYNCLGMRAGDLSLFKLNRVKNGTFAYRSKKSKDDFVDIDMTEEALSIYEYYARDKGPDDYLFPFFDRTNRKQILRKRLDSCTSMMNNGLKKIAAMAKIDSKITTHVSRHSFTMRHIEADTPMKAISGFLGHQSERTTKVYAGKLSNKVLSDHNKKVMGGAKISFIPQEA